MISFFPFPNRSPWFPWGGPTTIIAEATELSGSEFQLRDSLVRILAEETDLPPEELRPERTFKDLGIDSLGLVELIVRVEEESGVDFPVEMSGLGLDSTLAESVEALEKLIASAADLPEEAVTGVPNSH